MKRWLLLVASTLGLASQTTSPTEQQKESLVFVELSTVFDHITPIKEDLWSIIILHAAYKFEQEPEIFKKIWQEKINKNTTPEEFKKLDQQFRADVLDTMEGNTSLLCLAAKYFSLVFVQELLALGADASEVIKNDATYDYVNEITPLAAALLNETNDRRKIVEALLEHGAAKTIDTPLNENATVLHRSMSTHTEYDPELVKLFVENKADINAKTSYGDTPLHYAAQLSPTVSDDICRYLIENGADQEAKNNSGETPFQLAGYKTLQAWREHLYPELKKQLFKITKQIER